MVSRKLSIRDEPNIRLRCSRNVKNHMFTDEKRHRVYVQSVPVCSGTTRTCVSTCARGAGTHGDVLNLRTEGFFCVPSRATHHTTQNTHHTNHAHQHATTHGDRDRDRQRQRKKTGTEREEKTEEERQDKRREDKRRQDKTREERRFIFSVVVHGRFLLM